MAIIKTTTHKWDETKQAYDELYSKTNSEQVVDFSDAVKKILTGNLTMEERYAIMNAEAPPGAPSHNCFYRGKDLTEYFASGGMSEAIAAGNFEDIFIGDYIRKTVVIDGTEYKDVIWRVGDCDYNLGRGATNPNTHHVLMVPDGNLGTARMNASNTTAGAYQSSKMWTTTIPKYVTGITNAFGNDHVLEHKEILHNAMNADAWSAIGNNWKGASYTDWSKTPWATVKVNIFNTMMMYGSGIGASWVCDYSCNKQVSIFRMGQNFTTNYWCWLRDVASATAFALAGGDGSAVTNGASNSGGVRPYFLLH